MKALSRARAPPKAGGPRIRFKSYNQKENVMKTKSGAKAGAGLEIDTLG